MSSKKKDLSGASRRLHPTLLFCMIDTPIYSHPDLTPRSHLESMEKERMYKRWRASVDKLLQWHEPTRSFVAMVLCMTVASLLTSSPPRMPSTLCPVPWICSTLAYMTGIALLAVYGGAWVLRNHHRQQPTCSWVLDDVTVAALVLTILTSVSSILVVTCLAAFLAPVAFSSPTPPHRTDVDASVKPRHVSTAM